MDTSSFRGLVEFRSDFEPRPSISHVLFDFDGTLSLIRSGWPEVMVGLFVEVVPRLPAESEEDVRQLAYDDIMTLNGKQTIYQMIQLAERVLERGGRPDEPLAYKHEYLRRLETKIGSRIAGLRDKTLPPESLFVKGSIALLDSVRARGWTPYLASGTDETFVRREVELLGLGDYFGDRIYGALDDYKNFSKQMIIARILEEHDLDGRHLLAFGDGYVEIENTKQVGGLAVAVASDENEPGSGRIDEWKRQRLLGVGADVVVPDYQDVAPLLEALTGKEYHG